MTQLNKLAEASAVPFVVFIFVLICSFHSAESLTCYSCSAKSQDDYCVTNPGAVSSGSNTIDCNDNSTSSCTILRTEFTDIPGRVISFVRSCDENPLISNEIRTDAHYTKYYRTCKTRLCNSGDGILSGSGGNSNIPSEIIRVPAIGGAPPNSPPSRLMVVSLISFTTFGWMLFLRSYTSL